MTDPIVTPLSAAISAHPIQEDPMPFVIGHNLRGYSAEPDNLYACASLEDARSIHADTLERWADDCYTFGSDDPSEREDLESIAAELDGDAETIHEWLTERGGATVTRGPDGNEYTFWAEPRTVEELRADGWTDSELSDAGVIE